MCLYCVCVYVGVIVCPGERGCWNSPLNFEPVVNLCGIFILTFQFFFFFFFLFFFFFFSKFFLYWQRTPITESEGSLAVYRGEPVSLPMGVCFTQGAAGVKVEVKLKEVRGCYKGMYNAVPFSCFDVCHVL